MATSHARHVYLIYSTNSCKFTYWLNFETVSCYKCYKSCSTLSQGIILAVLHDHIHEEAISFTLPPFGGGLLHIKLNLGSLQVVRLSLRCDFPQALGIARILPSYTCAFILSDPARLVLGR